MKQCSKCNIIKDDIEFYQGRVCKVCHNIRVKIWQNNNKERCCENLKKWREKNKERNKERYSKTIKQYCIENAQKRKEYNIQWRKNNPEKYKETKRKWENLNKERRNKSRREYARNNSDRIKELAKKWYEEHKDSYKQWSSNYRKNNPEKIRKIALNGMRRYLATPKGRLSHLIAKRMRNSLKNGKSGKCWESLVDFNIDQLKEHLESQFTEGMTWEKFMNGEIHIDHKIPIAHFNYNSVEDEDFKKCWSLDNLQPLWAIDNFKKGKKIDWKRINVTCSKDILNDNCSAIGNTEVR